MPALPGWRAAGLTPVAAEIGDLALRAGRLAYRNPQWTPACSHASLTRDPADLARAPATSSPCWPPRTTPLTRSAGSRPPTTCGGGVEA